MPLDSASRDISGKVRHVKMADCPLGLRYGPHTVDSVGGICLVRGHVDGGFHVSRSWKLAQWQMRDRKVARVFTR